MNELFVIVLSLSVSGGLLALLLLGLRPLVSGRVSAGWQYYIWILVVLRLLIPFGPSSSPVSRLFHAAQERSASAAAHILAGEAADSTDPAASGTEAATDYLPPDPGAMPSSLETGTTADPSFQPTLFLALWILWLAGAFTLLIQKISSYQAFLRYIKAGCRPVKDGPLADVYGKLCSEMRLRHPPALRRNAIAAAPMLVGAFRPFIVLPELEDEAGCVEQVLRHELTHYRRGDIYYKWVAQLAACAHWFNPLVYPVLRAINRDCELSCDEAVVRSMDDEEKYRYGETLLSAIRPDPGYSSAIVSITLNEDTKRLKERLDALMTPRVKSPMAIVTTTLLTVALVIGAAWTGAYAADRQQKQTEPAVSSGVLPAGTADDPPALFTGDRAAREYLAASDIWQKFLAVNSASVNSWPNAIALQYKDAYAMPVESHFSVDASTDATLTLRVDSGTIGIVIRNDAGHVALSKSNMSSGQFLLHLPATGSRYSLELYVEAFTGGVLLEAVTTDTEPNTSATVNGSAGAAVTGPAALDIPEYLDGFDLWGHTSGSLITGEWPRYLMAQCVRSKTDKVETIFELEKPTTVVISAHGTAGALGVRIVGPGGVTVFDQPQILTARYRVHLEQVGSYNVHYTFQSYSGRMLLENEAYTNTFAGVNLGIEFGVNGGGTTEPADAQPALGSVESKSTGVDYAAYHILSYANAWNIVEYMLPYMTHEGIDAAVTLANEKNPPNQRRIASSYYNLPTPSRDESDERGWNICYNTRANWVYIEPMLPYMSKAGIDKVIAYYNQMTGSRLTASDYYS